MANRCSRGIAFKEFVEEAAHNKILVAEFDRLQGTNLSRQGTGLDLMIDDSSGRTDHDCKLFLEFCFDVWQRLPSEEVGP
jgi:hypothetical protein